MSVGLLLITHNRIGAELLDTATRMLGRCPLPALAIGVSEQDDPDQLKERLRRAARRVDRGGGLLILTDLYGATPSNVANRLDTGSEVVILTGVNLPMLVRVLNYAGLELPALAQKALSGGHDGVLTCPRRHDC